MAVLSALDASFIHMKSTRTPMHVGGLMIFKLPPDAPPRCNASIFAVAA